MKFYADTSFLASLYLRDVNCPAALAWSRQHRQALAFTALHRHELRNSVWLAVFRGLVAETVAHAVLADIERDVGEGWLDAFSLDWNDACREAERIADNHTARRGLRSLDLLHLGAARSVGAKIILSFDQRQLTAARAAGFQTGP